MPNSLSTISTRRPPAFRQHGAATIEFAISVCVLLLIGAGIVEFGRAFWYYDAIAKGTRDAARYLSIIPKANLGAAGATAQAIVADAATAGGVPGFSSANVTIACAPTCSAVPITSVTASATYALEIGAIFPFIASAGGGANSTFSVNLAPHTTMPYLW